MKKVKQTIQYWSGFLQDRRLGAQVSQDSRCREVIQALFSGATKRVQLDLKRCTGSLCLYTARLNDSDRLLFATVPNLEKSAKNAV